MNFTTTFLKIVGFLNNNVNSNILLQCLVMVVCIDSASDFKTRQFSGETVADQYFAKFIDEYPFRSSGISTARSVCVIHQTFSKC